MTRVAQTEDRTTDGARRSIEVLSIQPVLDTVGVGRTILEPGKWSIGSAPDCRLAVQAPGIDPRHCLLVSTPTRTFLKAWNRHTWVNDVPVSESPIRAGDRLAIGPVEFRFESVTIDDADAADPRARRNPPAPPASGFRPGVRAPETDDTEQTDPPPDQTDQHDARERLRQHLARLERDIAQQEAHLETLLDPRGPLGPNETPRFEHEAVDRRRDAPPAADLDELQQSARQNLERVQQDERRLRAEWESLLRERNQLCLEAAAVEDGRRGTEEWTLQLEDFQTQLDRCERRLRERDDELDQRARRLELLDEELTRRHTELEQLRERVDEEASRVHADQAARAERLDERESEVEQRAAELESRERELSTAAAERERQQREMDEASGAREELEALRRDVERREAELEARDQELAAERDAVTTARQQLQADREQLAAEREQLRDLEQRERELAEEQAELEARRAELERESADSTVGRTALAPNARVELDESALVEREQDLEFARREFELEREDFAHDVEALEDERALLEAERESLRVESRALDRRREELAALEASLDETFRHLEAAEHEVHTQSEAATERERQELAEQRARLESQQAELDEQRSLLEEQRRQFDEEREEASHELDRVRAELDHVRRDLDERSRADESRRADLEAREQALREERDCLDETRADLESERQELSTTRSELQRERDSLREEIERARETLLEKEGASDETEAESSQPQPAPRDDAFTPAAPPGPTEDEVCRTELDDGQPDADSMLPETPDDSQDASTPTPVDEAPRNVSLFSNVLGAGPASREPSPEEQEAAAPADDVPDVTSGPDEDGQQFPELFEEPDESEGEAPTGDGPSDSSDSDLTAPADASHVRNALADMFGISELTSDADNHGQPATTAAEPPAGAAPAGEPGHDEAAPQPANDVDSAERATGLSTASLLDSFRASETGQPPAAREPEGPAPAGSEQSADPDEDSVAAYMDRLLARTRRTAQPAEAPADVEAAHEQRPHVPSQENEAVEEAPPAPDVEEASLPAPRPDVDRDAMRRDIDSLRQVANISARSAIATSTAKRVRGDLFFKTVLTVVSSTIAGVLLTSELWIGVSYGLYGWIAAGLAAFCAVELARATLLVHTLKAGPAPDEGGTPAAEPDEAVAEPSPAPATNEPDQQNGTAAE